MAIESGKAGMASFEQSRCVRDLKTCLLYVPLDIAVLREYAGAGINVGGDRLYLYKYKHLWSLDDVVNAPLIIVVDDLWMKLGVLDEPELLSHVALKSTAQIRCERPELVRVRITSYKIQPLWP